MRIAYQKQGLTPPRGFDLSEPGTYYTRPMSSPWSKPLDVDRLADGEADVDFAVPLAELPGLRARREAVAGSVNGRVHFAREQGLAVAELVLRGVATLQCQRCMRPMQQALDLATRIALIPSESAAARVPADLEPVLAEGARITIGELITEELLLALPIVPLHESPCTGPPPATAAEHGGETHRPFARLGELLKR
jgi:DUF177 domain-containing protein